MNPAHANVVSNQLRTAGHVRAERGISGFRVGAKGATVVEHVGADEDGRILDDYSETLYELGYEVTTVQTQSARFLIIEDRL